MSSNDASTDVEVVEEAAEPDTAREAVVEQLTAELGDAFVASHLEPGIDLTVRVTPEAWGDTGAFLRTGMGFAYFNFLSAIDWMPSPFGRDMDSQVDLTLGHDEKSEIDSTIETGTTGGDTRFQVFARVNDIVNHLAVTVKADVPDDSLTVPSWVATYGGANWHEREAWEMFGISFDGHPGLRHIYLPGEFEGNPLRKDYPLLARRVKPWPGIVDVEAMPGDDDEDDASTSADAGGEP
ncbi:MAG: NADH-quinone oxidoreductase subunit C [Acidimicrobiales bacterium]|nr:NADH-quinone oxidoreductase subunit C [Acidimicrobiales bacterium]